MMEDEDEEVIIEEDDDEEVDDWDQDFNDNEGEEREYTCSKCSYKSTKPHDYLTHQQTEHEEEFEIFKCPHCIYATRHENSKQRHVFFVHGGEEDGAEGGAADDEPSILDDSDEESEDVSKNDTSNAEDDKNSEEYVCSECDYKTHIKDRYERHIKYHSMPPLKCDKCDFETPYKWKLDMHTNKDHPSNDDDGETTVKLEVDDIEIKEEKLESEPSVPQIAIVKSLVSEPTVSQVTIAKNLESEPNVPQVTIAKNLESEPNAPQVTITKNVESEPSVPKVTIAKNVESEPTAPEVTIAKNLESEPTVAKITIAKNLESEPSVPKITIAKNLESEPSVPQITIAKNLFNDGAGLSILEDSIMDESSNSATTDSDNRKRSVDITEGSENAVPIKKPKMKVTTKINPALMKSPEQLYTTTCDLCDYKGTDVSTHKKVAHPEVFGGDTSITVVNTTPNVESFRKNLNFGDATFSGNRNANFSDSSVSGAGASASTSYSSDIVQEGESLEMEVTPTLVWNKLEDDENSKDSDILVIDNDEKLGASGPTPEEEHLVMKKVYKCPQCEFWATTASRFHVHIVAHVNQKPFKCSDCFARSNWQWDITKHIKSKASRNEGHQNAYVQILNESGQRNYEKYEKFMQLMWVDKSKESNPKFKTKGSGDEISPSPPSGSGFSPGAPSSMNTLKHITKETLAFSQQDKIKPEPTIRAPTDRVLQPPMAVPGPPRLMRAPGMGPPPLKAGPSFSSGQMVSSSGSHHQAYTTQSSVYLHGNMGMYTVSGAGAGPPGAAAPPYRPPQQGAKYPLILPKPENEQQQQQLNSPAAATDQQKQPAEGQKKTAWKCKRCGFR